MRVYEHFINVENYLADYAEIASAALADAWEYMGLALQRKDDLRRRDLLYTPVELISALRQYNDEMREHGYILRV